MIKQYTEWINENFSKERIAIAFIDNLKKELDFLEDSGVLEDWWSISGKNFDENGYGDYATERLERGKPESQRTKSDVYLLEFKVRSGENSHIWALGSLDTRDWKLDMNAKFLNIRDEIQEIYDKTLQKEFPQEHIGRKYGI